MLNRIKWYVPLFIALAALTVVCGVFGGFDYLRYLGKPVSLSQSGLKAGTYVRIRMSDTIATYAVYGLDPETNAEQEYEFRYLVAPVGDNIIGIRLTKSQQKLIENPNAELIGTLRKSPPDIHKLLRDWAAGGYWTDKDQLEIGRLTPDIVLYVGYKGNIPVALGFILCALAFIFAVGTIGSAVRFVLLILKKRYDDFPADAQIFSDALVITREKVLLIKPLVEYELNRSEISKVFPRSKRLEGGKLKWSLVFSANNREYIVWLITEDKTKEALIYFQSVE
jgi:hypothetical protein